MPATDKRVGFRSLNTEISVAELAVSGVLPAWLAGSLLRTGPARFEVGQRELAHWFDGLAMLHRFSFADGRVEYANRFLESDAFKAAEQAGKIEYGEFATDPCRSLFKRMTTIFRPPAFTDNGNVNVGRLGDEFVAMSETPLAVAFDPHTLAAAGVVPRPPGHLSTAHPHAAAGASINFATKLGPRSSYRFFQRRGREIERVIAQHPVREPAYVHSFGLSERHLVLLEHPFVVNPLRLALGGRPYIENYRWEPDRGTNLLVFDRASGRHVRSFAADPCFCFHHVNTFERDGELVVDAITYEDADVVRETYMDRLRGEAALAPSRLRRYTLDLASGATSERVIGNVALELPRINYGAVNGRPHRFVFGAGQAAQGGGWLDRVVKLDADDGSHVEWREPGCWPGEPVFVPDPAGEGEDHGVLLSVVLDAAAERSFLLVLDARDLNELARAEVPHAIPFGFHGQFASAARM